VNRNQSTVWALIRMGVVCLACLMWQASYAGERTQEEAARQPHRFPYEQRSVLSLPATDADALRIENENGAIVVEGWDRPDIAIEIVKRADQEEKLGQVEVKRERSGAEEHIRTEQHLKMPDRDWRDGAHWSYYPPLIELRIHTPRRIDLTVQSSNASVTAAGMEGAADLTSYNNQVTWRVRRGVGEAIRASTYNGDILPAPELGLTRLDGRNVAGRVGDGGRAVRLNSYNSIVHIEPDTPRNWEFKNGLWYNGRDFQRGTWYCVDGVLTRSKPARIDRTLDLHNGYVTPPLADAHCHHFDGLYNAPLISRYLREGVFYAQSMGNWIQGRDDLLPLLNRPDSVDVAFANAGLTGTLGHPYFTYELLANPTSRPATPEENLERVRNSRKGEGKVYFFVDNVAMLDNVWPRYLASKPDLVKIFLLDSANYERHRAEAVPGQNGLPPQIVPEIVRRAHTAGLRVYAHVETAYDFHVAVAAGVDGLAHMPGYSMGTQDGKTYLIAEADARMLGARGGVVQLTASLAPNYTAGDPEALMRVQAVQKRNLALLRRCGVRIAIGADYYGQGPWREVDYLLQYGFLSPRDLFRYWVETTPETIFPARKIGRLAAGYECSFLVIPGDPTREIRRLHDIRVSFKQGCLLQTGVQQTDSQGE
jgi:hypothetical protein